MNMTCPKCHASMRQFERSGVTIDQCSECRGIFLDRGELEHLIDADAQFNASPDTPPPPRTSAPAPPPPVAPQPTPVPGYAPPPSPYGHSGYGRPHYKHGAHYKHQYQGGGYGYGYKKKRRKSFFEELFD